MHMLPNIKWCGTSLPTSFTTWFLKKIVFTVLRWKKKAYFIIFKGLLLKQFFWRWESPTSIKDSIFLKSWKKVMVLDFLYASLYHQHISHHCSVSMPPGNVRKPEVLWHFQGVENWTIGVKWVNDTFQKFRFLYRNTVLILLNPLL